MSNWDFGYGTEPAERHESQYPQPPDRITFRFDDVGYPEAERDAFDGGSSRPAVPPPAAPTSAAPTSAAYPFAAYAYASAAPQGGTAPYQPWPAALDPADQFDGGHFADAPERSGPPPRGLDTDDMTRVLPPEGVTDGAPGLLDELLRADPRGPRHSGGAAPGQPRWLIPVAVALAAAALGVTAVLLTNGNPSTPAAAGPVMSTKTSSPAASRSAAMPTMAAPAMAAATAPLTVAAARSVLSGYTTVNNSANAQRSNAMLAEVETGGSYAIDTGLYTVQRAADAKPYPAFAPVTATYYIPRAEPGDGPRWFVVWVANAFAANPQKVTSTEYLLFTQAAPGGPWQNAVEPYLLSGADAPQIAIGSDGLATAVSVAATPLSALPSQLAELTATSLNGTDGGISVTDSSGLADRIDQKSWHGKLPTATVTDTHAAATGTADGRTFALLTTNGGALVFYTDAAQLTITPPAGSMLHLTVPGLYSPAQALTTAGLSYLDQFAAYDPPAGAGEPSVIAAYSGVTGRN